MKDASSLSHEELLDIVEELQVQLFSGVTGGEDNESIVPVWDPDCEWDSEDIQVLADKLRKYDLVPEFLGDEPKGPSSSCEICGGPNH
ncbi:MAG: hypothetical protein JRD89_02050 [Deltaproteobacteria bacterium]|nr:hypothetical protein [Deltaproteobacteria bacterium]